MEQIAERAVVALEEQGWCVIDDALPEAIVAALANECAAARPTEFKPAGIGRRDDYQRDTTIRSDRIRWIEPSLDAGQQYLALMDELRGALNRRLYLGLFDYECHYARYEPGAFYRKHLDSFTGSRNRVLSTVLYLNRDWRTEEGGELCLYRDEKGIETILPEWNRFAIFLSERFPHEVKPATRERLSIAGWFRVRS